MIRVHIICEGQTEETFVNNALVEYFSLRGIALFPSLVGKPGHKGGNFKEERLLVDVRTRLAGDSEAYCTTLFDYYALPPAFPGKSKSSIVSSSEEKSKIVCNELAIVIESKLGSNIGKRFIPYVQMYEFEGLLFSDPQKFARGIDQPSLTQQLSNIRNSFASPEDINDSPQTAPSKRIKSLVPGYQKPIMGLIGIKEIGLDVIRRECKLFNAWLQALEQLAIKLNESLMVPKSKSRSTYE